MTLEQRLDSAIERCIRIGAENDALLEELAAMYQTLDELQAGHRQPQVQLTAEQLEEMDEENPGAEISRCPWKW